MCLGINKGVLALKLMYPVMGTGHNMLVSDRYVLMPEAKCKHRLSV